MTIQPDNDRYYQLGSHDKLFNQIDELTDALASRDAEVANLAALGSSYLNLANAAEQECESLRQQLADEFDKREALDNELADHIKREVMLRKALYNIKTYADSIDDADNLCEEALTATADLDGLILCDADHVSFLHEESLDEYTIPLYRAWEPK
jgi:regulator of replication initiation timing